MTNKLAAAVAAIAVVVALGSAAMAAEGPKVSTGNYIAPAAAGTPVSTYDASRMGPKVSSENHIAASPTEVVASAQPVTGGQHWIYQQGYDAKGRWHSDQVLVP